MNYKTYVGLAALIGSMHSGCIGLPVLPKRECPLPLTLTEEMKQKIEKHQAKFREGMPDPFNGLKYLKEGEYVLPSEIMRARWMAGRPSAKTVPWDIWKKDAVTSCSFQKRLKKNLDAIILTEVVDLRFTEEEEVFLTAEKPLRQEDKEVYLAMSLLPEVIYYNENIFLSDYFYTIITHERTHKIRDLVTTEAESRVLHEAYGTIRSKRYPLNQQGIEAAQKDGVPVEDIQKAEEKKDACSIFPLLFPDCNYLSIPFITKESVTKGPEFDLPREALDNGEFYPYAISGTMPQRVEFILKRDHPEAYKIFLRIRDEAKPY